MAFTNDEFYGGGNPTPVPTTTTTTPVPPGGPVDCIATPNGGGFDLSWTEDGFANIRRNGSWLARAPDDAKSYFDPSAPAGSTYIVRVRPGNLTIDLECVAPPVDDPPVDDPPVDDPPVDDPPVDDPPVDDPECVATADGNNVILTWDDFEGRNFLRLNDRWLASPAVGATSFVHFNAPADSTYVVRNRPAGGGFVDYECVQSGDVAPPPPPIAGCTITIDGQGATLTWDFDDRAIVRKNGTWLATVSVGQIFTDPVGTVADSYVLRTWPPGGMVDYDC